MRTVIRAAIILVFVSGPAFAKGKKGAAEAKSGAGMMDSNDPAEKETSDKGPFAPKTEAGEAGDEKAAPAVTEAPPEVVKPRPRDPFVVFGNVLIGFGQAPEPGVGADKTTGKATSFTLMAGGRYDVSHEFSLGLRLPWTTASVRELGIAQSSQALGTPELMGEYRVGLGTFTRLPIDFGIGIPVAQGNFDRNDLAKFRQGYVNDIADAASGYRDGELFMPKRMPVIVGVGLEYERKPLSLTAFTKFVVGVNVGGTVNIQTIGGTYELKKVSLRNVTGGGIAYQFLDKPVFYGALDAWVASKPIDAYEFNSTAGATPPTRFQVAFEPRVGARFGKISPSLGYIFPIGGRLADSGISGLELHCDVAF